MSHLAGVQAGSVTVGLSVGAALLSGRRNPDLHADRIPTSRFASLRVYLISSSVECARAGSIFQSADYLPPKSKSAFTSIFCSRTGSSQPCGMAIRWLTLDRLRIWSTADWALTTDDPTYIAHLAKHFSALGLPAPRIRLRCESFLTLLQLAPHMDFVVAISHTLLRHPLTAEHLRAIEISDPCPTARFALVRKADVPLTPHAKALAHYITAAATELRQQGAGTAIDPWTGFRKTLDKDTRRRSHAPVSHESRMQLRG